MGEDSSRDCWLPSLMQANFKPGIGINNNRLDSWVRFETVGAKQFVCSGDLRHNQVNIAGKAEAAVLLRCVRARYQVCYACGRKYPNGFAECLFEHPSFGGFAEASRFFAI